MISTKEVIMLLKLFKSESASKYGITSLGLFGSFARNQQKETSDVDVFVTLKESDFFVLERIKEELENLVQFSSVDIVNYRESLRNSFKQNQSTSKAIPSQILQLLTQSPLLGINH